MATDTVCPGAAGAACTAAAAPPAALAIAEVGRRSWAAPAAGRPIRMGWPPGRRRLVQYYVFLVCRQKSVQLWEIVHTSCCLLERRPQWFIHRCLALGGSYCGWSPSRRDFRSTWSTGRAAAALDQSHPHGVLVTF